MSSPVGTYLDTGGIPWDSFTQTINGTTFIFENFRVTEGSASTVSTDQYNVPRAKKHVKTVITATGTVQFTSGETLAATPTLFGIVAVPYRGAAAKSFIVTEVVTMQQKGEETKCNLNFEEQLNATS